MIHSPLTELPRLAGLLARLAYEAARVRDTLRGSKVEVTGEEERGLRKWAEKVLRSLEDAGLVDREVYCERIRALSMDDLIPGDGACGDLPCTDDPDQSWDDSVRRYCEREAAWYRQAQAEVEAEHPTMRRET